MLSSNKTATAQHGSPEVPSKAPPPRAWPHALQLIRQHAPGPPRRRRAFSRTIATAAADASMSLSWLTTSEAYKSPAFIALVSALCVAVLLLLHHCVLVNCGRDRRQRRQSHQRRGVVTTTTSSTGSRRDNDGDDEAEDVSGEVSATSRTHLVAAAVVCRYRKEEAWKETTCPVCLADFDEGEAVRVLPECMHYFHAECIDTWLRGNTSCPMCRAETTPTPTPSPTTTPTSASVRHHLELSASLEEILARS